jgi:hypothetical protein
MALPLLTGPAGQRRGKTHKSQLQRQLRDREQIMQMGGPKQRHVMAANPGTGKGRWQIWWLTQPPSTQGRSGNAVQVPRSCPSELKQKMITR